MSMNPDYPVYIISKGRWERRLTSRTLEAIGVPYQIVVEPQEYARYAGVIEPSKILVLPFSNLGQGSIPARNWVWEHAISTGSRRHWILDDNISSFYRLNRNLKTMVTSGTIFKVAEDFVDRYENVAIAGFNYHWLCVATDWYPAYYLNTRIYSCILIQNDLEHRWRGRYNEDTDLSLRVLKDGLCTVLFNAFLCSKQSTMTAKGGNTDELYQGDGRLKMALSLVDQHPDLVTVKWQYGRWQHAVDYRPFLRTHLVRREDLEIPDGVNEFGMALREVGKATCVMCGGWGIYFIDRGNGDCPHCKGRGYIRASRSA
jgi:hypothetical protein